jgi:hypothetical protein
MMLHFSQFSIVLTPTPKRRANAALFVSASLDFPRVIKGVCDGPVGCHPIVLDFGWHNPLKGFGTGLASITTENGARSGLAAVLAEKQRQDQASAASTVTT